jgi:hypothetical protein
MSGRGFSLDLVEYGPDAGNRPVYGVGVGAAGSPGDVPGGDALNTLSSLAVSAVNVSTGSAGGGWLAVLPPQVGAYLPDRVGLVEVIGRENADHIAEDRCGDPGSVGLRDGPGRRRPPPPGRDGW